MSHRLLIIDDDTALANTFARVLRLAGFECLVAYDSPEALVLFDSSNPALVLSDINLPTDDGFEITRYARKKSEQTPVILMTGNNDERLRKEAAQAGATRYLQKPFSNSELIATIKATLGGGGQPL